EGIDAPQQALSLVARAARGSFRDATSTLDQLAAATEKQISVQSVLQLLGTVEEDALFRLCDLVVDRDTAGALTFVEELSEQGHDLGRLVSDLIEHLRHLMLVQHMHEVPESLPVTEETRERLRAQANQLGEAAVVRLLDLLAVAVDDMRQGGDPRRISRASRSRTGSSSSSRAGTSLSPRLRRLRPPPPSRCACRRRSAARRTSSSSSFRKRGCGRSFRRSRSARSRSRPFSARRDPRSSTATR